MPKTLFMAVVSVLLLAICTQGVFAATADTKTSQAKVQFSQPSGGLLTLDHVPDLDFGTQTASLTDQTYQSLVDGYVRVTDKGSNATGWNVTVSAAAFKNGAATPDTLEGATIHLNTGLVSIILGVVNQLLGLPAANTAITLPTDDSAVNAISAGNGLLPYGMGSWDTTWLKNNISLDVVGGSMNTDSLYTSTMTWTLTDAP